MTLASTIFMRSRRGGAGFGSSLSFCTTLRGQMRGTGRRNLRGSLMQIFPDLSMPTTDPVQASKGRAKLLAAALGGLLTALVLAAAAQAQVRSEPPQGLREATPRWHALTGARLVLTT